MALSVDWFKQFWGTTTTTTGKVVALGTGALALGGTGLAIAGAIRAKRKKTRKATKKKTTKRKTSTKKRKSKRTYKTRGRRTPNTAGKGKDRSTKRIRYTKKGQPYVIMKSGKSRFIKKSSAKQSHKRKGGRY